MSQPALYEYAQLRTTVPLRSRYRPGYIHPVGTEATFHEALLLPDAHRGILPIGKRGVTNERGQAVWLIEVHAPDASLVGDYWHEVFHVPHTSVRVVDDEGLGEFLKAAKTMERIGTKLAGRSSRRHLVTVVVDVLLGLAREVRVTQDDLVRGLREAWEKNAVRPRERHGARSRSCTACEGGDCIECGTRMHDDGSRVTWRCQQCGHLVCRGCTLTIPGRLPPEYYHQTFCGEDCWRRFGSPEE